jgi:hypothetical protein
MTELIKSARGQGSNRSLGTHDGNAACGCCNLLHHILTRLDQIEIRPDCKTTIKRHTKQGFFAFAEKLGNNMIACRLFGETCTRKAINVNELAALWDAEFTTTK